MTLVVEPGKHISSGGRFQTVGNVIRPVRGVSRLWIIPIARVSAKNSGELKIKKSTYDNSTVKISLYVNARLTTCCRERRTKSIIRRENDDEIVV